MDHIKKSVSDFQKTGQILPQQIQPTQHHIEMQLESTAQLQINQQMDKQNTILINTDEIFENIDESSVLGKRKKSSRMMIKNKKYITELETDLNGNRQVSFNKSKKKIQIADENIQIEDQQEQNFDGINDDTDELEEDGEIDGQNTMNNQNQGANRKQNFTRAQTSILKKWFIQHAENPYLKEESRNELSIKTGLGPRQVSNWFTNVRKRIWQPIKKKNKNKGAKDLMLKVKLRLESDGNSCSSSSVNNRSSGHQIQDSMQEPQQTQELIPQGHQAIAAQQVNAFKLLEGGITQASPANTKNLRSLPQPVSQQHRNKGQDNFYVMPNRKPLHLAQSNTMKIPCQMTQVNNLNTDRNMIKIPNWPLDQNSNNVDVPFQATGKDPLEVTLRGLQLELASRELASKIGIFLNQEVQGDSALQTPICQSKKVLNEVQFQKPQVTYDSPASGDEYAQQKFQLSQKMSLSPNNGAITGEQYISDPNNDHPSRKDLLESIRNFRQNIMSQENKRILKENSKNEEEEGAAGDGNSDITAKDQNKRSALKQFMRKSRVLRFREKMQNVKLWRTNSILFAADNSYMIELPAEADGPIDEIDFKMIDQIEKEFSDHERKMNEAALQQAQEKEKDNDLYKRRKLNELDAKEICRANQGLCKDDTNFNAEQDDSVPHGANSAEVPVSLPRSKSLSNNRSAHSSKNEVAEDSNGNIASYPQGLPYQFIPIILICCPRVVRGETCGCGYDGYYPANDIYSNQLSQFLQNQQAMFGQNTNQSQDQGNSGRSGAGGSGASGFAESGIGGACRNVGGSNPTSGNDGNSWQTTAQNPLNFIALLNSLHPIGPNQTTDCSNPTTVPILHTQETQKLETKLSEIEMVNKQLINQAITSSPVILNNINKPRIYQQNTDINKIHTQKEDKTSQIKQNVDESKTDQKNQSQCRNMTPSSSLFNNKNGQVAPFFPQKRCCDVPSNSLSIGCQQQFLIPSHSTESGLKNQQEKDLSGFKNLSQAGQMISQVQDFEEICSSLNHLNQMKEMKRQIQGNEDPPTPDSSKGLKHLASVVAGAAELVESGQGRPSDQKLHEQVQRLIGLMISEQGAITSHPHAQVDKQQVKSNCTRQAPFAQGYQDLLMKMAQHASQEKRENVNSASDPSGSCVGHGKSSGSGQTGSKFSGQSQSKSGLGSGTIDCRDGNTKKGNEYSHYHHSGQDLQSRQSRLATAPGTNKVFNSTSEVSAIEFRQSSRNNLGENKGESSNFKKLALKQQMENKAIEQMISSHDLGHGPEGLSKLMNLLSAQVQATLQTNGDSRVQKLPTIQANSNTIVQAQTQQNIGSERVSRLLSPFPSTVAKSMQGLGGSMKHIEIMHQQLPQIGQKNPVNIEHKNPFDTLVQLKKGGIIPQQGNLMKQTEVMNNLPLMIQKQMHLRRQLSETGRSINGTVIKDIKSIYPAMAPQALNPIFAKSPALNPIFAKSTSPMTDKTQSLLSLIQQQNNREQNCSVKKDDIVVGGIPLKSKLIEILQQKQSPIISQFREPSPINVVNNISSQNIQNMMAIQSSQIMTNLQESDRNTQVQPSPPKIAVNPIAEQTPSTSAPIGMQLFNKLSAQLFKAIEVSKTSGNGEDQQKLIGIVQTLIDSAAHVPVPPENIPNHANLLKPDNYQTDELMHEEKPKPDVESGLDELTLDPRIQNKLHQIHDQDKVNLHLSQIQQPNQEDQKMV